MASNAERLNANAPQDTGAEAQQSSHETSQPVWDIPALYQSDNRPGAKKSLSEFNSQPEQVPQKEYYKSPFASPQITPGTETYKSPYALPQTESPLPKLVRREPTSMEILANKPMTDITMQEIGVLAKDAANWVASIDSDYAGMGGLVFRYKSEMLRQKFPVNSSLIAGVAAVPLTGVSGYMLNADVQNFNKTTSIGQKAYYATASAVDATALAGSIGTLFPKARPVAGTVAALSFLGRAGMGWAHSTFFSEKK